MRSRGVANRVALALVGSALIAGAATATGTAGAMGIGAGVASVRARLGEHPTAAPALVGCLGLFLGVTLLVARVRGRAPRRRLSLTAPGCTLDAGALRRAVRGGCAEIPGVVRARCRLTGTGARPRLAVTLHLDPGARPDEVLAALTTTVLPPVAALLPPRLDTEVRLRVRRPRAGRTV
ncbi:hypothetical protein [Streptomyces sp. NPDC048606]|uniref:hypothetical protein n=1 Tax=Streptomyces sp. NPDC048606 TaxID=3154726 RepID=UPI003440A3C2